MMGSKFENIPTVANHRNGPVHSKLATRGKKWRQKLQRLDIDLVGIEKYQHAAHAHDHSIPIACRPQDLVQVPFNR